MPTMLLGSTALTSMALAEWLRVRLKQRWYLFALPCKVPYRIDISHPPPATLDLLVQLGALDVEPVANGLAAILPDSVSPDRVTAALEVARNESTVTVSAAVPRDDGSVWLLSPGAVRIGNILIASPEAANASRALRLIDATAFGTGHHPTTALCIEALDEIIQHEPPDSVLDVGTGSGILALAALSLGVPQAVGLDIDPEALKAAAENARLNNLDGRLRLILGGPAVVSGSWPLVVANVLAAPLIDMAPSLIRRVGTRGKLILSGIRESLEPEVRRSYQHFGMRPIASRTRDGWTLLVLQASW